MEVVNRALAEKLCDAALVQEEWSPENNKALSDYTSLFTERFKAFFPNRDFMLAHLVCRASNMTVGDSVRAYLAGLDSPSALASLHSATQEDKNDLFKQVVLPHFQVDGSPDTTVYRNAIRKNAMNRAFEAASLFLSKKTDVSRKKEESVISDPVTLEISWDDYSAMLKKFETEHGGIALQAHRTPTRSLIAFLKKMKRTASWTLVSLEKCHPASSFGVGNQSALTDETVLTLSTNLSLIAQAKTKKESKEVMPGTFFSCLEILRLALHMTGICDEHVFQNYVEQIREKSVHFPWNMKEFMKCDARIRSVLVEHMLHESITFEAAMKRFCDPKQTVGVALWHELMFVNPETRMAASAPPRPQPRQPPTQPPGGDGRVKPGPKKAAKRGKGDADSPPKMRAKDFEPFVMNKEGKKLCIWFNYKACNPPQAGGCLFEHVCMHKNCAQPHPAAANHKQEWERVFGERNPVHLMSKGKGKGKGAKGGAARR